MTEVTIDILIECALDFLHSVATKRELNARCLLTTKTGQHETFDFMTLMHEPAPVQEVIRVIAQASSYDQIVAVTEVPGYQLSGVATAEVMRMTEGKAETVDEMSRLIQSGVLSYQIIPNKYLRPMVLLTAQSLRSGRTQTMVLQLEGEVPNRQIVPMEEIWDSMNNALLPLIPPPENEMTPDQVRRTSLVSLAMITSPDFHVHHAKNLNPDKAMKSKS